MMGHLSAAFVLVLAFSNLSYGGTADPADPAGTAGRADAVTTGSAITKEMFLEKMQSSGPYWTWMATYQDPTQTQKRTCISTEEVTETTDSTDTVFLQKYKFEGCDWFTYTHDAYYNVTFEERRQGATDGLKMRWVPIADVTKPSSSNTKVYGTERDYTFKYWDEKEECFVLTYNSSEDKKECELLVWKPELTAKTAEQVETEARTDGKTEMRLQERFQECKSQYKTECPKASEEILFNKYCKITGAEFIKLISSKSEQFDISKCSQ
uniref:Lipocalin/cytosolic fatty-acid binding domain-containing protein n=1 Tax=Amblyomma maculatum TaxID=34609 RepID=G3MKB2_AMBMU